MQKSTKLFLRRKLPIILAFPALIIPAGYSITSSITHNKAVSDFSFNTSIANNPFSAIDKSNFLVFGDVSNIQNIDTNNASNNFVAFSSNSAFNVLNSNNFNLNKSISLFNKQTDFSLLKGEGQFLNFDIKNFGVNLLRKQLNGFIITDLRISNLLVDNKPIKQQQTSNAVTRNVIPSDYSLQRHTISDIETNDNSEIKFGSKLNFDFDISFVVSNGQSISVGNKSFVLNPNKQYNLNLKALEQSINPTINNFAGNKYVGWILDKVEFSLANETWNESINVTQDYYSNVFKTQIKGIEDKLSYFDLVKQNQSKLDDYLTNNFKDVLKAKFDNNFEREFSLASDVNKVLYELLKDDQTSMIQVLKNNFTTILSFLAKSNIIDNFFVDAIIKTFELNTKQGLLEIVNKPFYELVRNKKDDLLKTIGVTSNSVINTLLVSYEELFKGITDNFDLSFILNPLKDLVKDDALYKSVENVIRQQLFGLDKGKEKSLFDLIFDNLALVQNVINKVVKNDTVKQFVSLLLTKDKKTGKENNIYDLLFATDSNDKKEDVINLILKALGKDKQANINKVVKAVFTNNKLLTKASFTKLTKNLVEFTNKFFARKENSTDFFDSFENLKFERTFKTYQYKSESSSLTYEYEIKFNLIKPAEFSLFKDLKALVNVDVLIDVVNAIKPDNPLKDKKSIIGLTNLETILKDLFPDTITFGIDTTKLEKQKEDDKKSHSYSFVYQAKDKQIWLVPSINKTTGAYDLGFNFPIEKSFKFEDYYAIESLTKQFENTDKQKFNLTAGLGGWLSWLSTTVADVTVSLKDFYIKPIQQLLLNPITTYTREIYVVENEKISDQQTYNETSFSGFSFNGIVLNDSEKQQIKKLLKNYDQKQTDNTYFKEIKSANEQNNKLASKQTNKTFELPALKPLISNELKTKLDELITKKLDELFKQVKDQNITNYNYDLRYEIKHLTNPKLDLNIHFTNSGVAASFLKDLKDKTYSISLDLGWYSLDIQVHLPFKVFDETKKELTDKYIFNISETKTDTKFAESKKAK